MLLLLLWRHASHLSHHPYLVTRLTHGVVTTHSLRSSCRTLLLLLLLLLPLLLLPLLLLLHLLWLCKSWSLLLLLLLLVGHERSTRAGRPRLLLLLLGKLLTWLRLLLLLVLVLRLRWLRLLARSWRPRYGNPRRRDGSSCRA